MVSKHVRARRIGIIYNATSMAETSPSNALEKIPTKNHSGEIHSSMAPILLALAITLCLGGLLILPLAFLGVPLLIFSIFNWVKEDVKQWKHRTLPIEGEWNNSRWAMIWIIVTEVVVFASFFAYWFWAKWHTVSWEGAVGGTWPAEGVSHNLSLVTLNTAVLISSGFIAHKGIQNLGKGNVKRAKSLIAATILLGLIFLGIQIFEYSHAAFTWDSHAYGTAFFALTGLHGLHVLLGVIGFIVSWTLIQKGYFLPNRHESLHAIGWYWHFVDVIWILLYLIVYLEVI
ncbi:MAG: cytochrome c oxidase subunit 3 [Candidatus Thalassarchaeaceae archaeon]|nr:cytochrome c oxidase subunit 3 [Candidatus Thalassarchaeaceae archaeon]